MALDRTASTQQMVNIEKKLTIRRMQSETQEMVSTVSELKKEQIGRKDKLQSIQLVQVAQSTMPCGAVRSAQAQHRQMPCHVLMHMQVGDTQYLCDDSHITNDSISSAKTSPSTTCVGNQPHSEREAARCTCSLATAQGHTMSLCARSRQSSVVRGEDAGQ